MKTKINHMSKKHSFLGLATRASTFKFRSNLLDQMPGRSGSHEMKAGGVSEDRTLV